jgi:hypothetical protein
LSDINFSFQAGWKRLIDNKPTPLVNEDDPILLRGSKGVTGHFEISRILKTWKYGLTGDGFFAG